jgi:hypothetical protein
MVRYANPHVNSQSRIRWGNNSIVKWGSFRLTHTNDSVNISYEVARNILSNFHKLLEITALEDKNFATINYKYCNNKLLHYVVTLLYLMMYFKEIIHLTHEKIKF